MKVVAPWLPLSRCMKQVGLTERADGVHARWTPIVLEILE